MFLSLDIWWRKTKVFYVWINSSPLLTFHQNALFAVVFYLIRISRSWPLKNIPKSSLVWDSAIVCERVKGFGQLQAGEWRMGLLCAPLLSRGPGVRGQLGKGFVMSQACFSWVGLLFFCPAHNPFHWISLSVALSSTALLLKKGQFVMWVIEPDHPHKRRHF